MYNKNNLTNIYEYDPKLIDKINRNLELYKHNGNESTYMVIIKKINKNFEYFKKDHRLIYYLTDRVYDDFPLIQIHNYIDALKKVYKKNNYNALLLNIKNIKHLDNYFNNLKNLFSINKREALENRYIELSEAFPDDAEYKEILHLIQNAKSEFIEIVRDEKDNLKVNNIANEEEILEKIYKISSNTLHTTFLKHLELLKIEKPKPNYNETEQDIEMEM